MKVLVLGATGYVGGVLVEELQKRGHEVAAVVRPSGDGGKRLPAVRDERHGDLSGEIEVTADIDAIVHTAQLTGDESVDAKVIGGLVASGKRVVYVSGVWVLGRTDGGDEASPVNPVPIVGYRPNIERLVTDGGGIVIRPGVVHGRGGGIPNLYLGIATEQGTGIYVGEGAEVAPYVHVEDLAELIVTAVEKGSRGPSTTVSPRRV